MFTRKFQLFADFFQFHLRDDRDAGSIGNLGLAWHDDGASERRMAVAAGIAGLRTARNMAVSVTLAMLDAAPDTSFDEWDHVVEGPLLIESGRIVIAGCTDNLKDAARVPVTAGLYRVRFSSRDLATVAENGLDGDDSYLVQIWRAPAAEPSEVKLHKRAGHCS